MSKAIIYGNGKSRLGFNVDKKYKDITTWGCNKIHHEGAEKKRRTERMGTPPTYGQI